MDPRHAAALDQAISADRFSTYLEAGGDDTHLARKLYVWDRDLSSAVLADIAIVEVALRNALNHALTTLHGPEWYLRDIGLDDRTRRKLAGAWDSLPKARRTPGRLVAQLMFGFWVDLLDSGGSVGKAPQEWRVDHEDLWRAGLAGAFRGGRKEARAIGARFTRSWVHEQVQTIQVLRNRAAHHEPLLTGIPRPGQRQSARPRFSVQDGYDTYTRVLRMIDRDLAEWVVQESRVPTQLSGRP